MPKEVRHIGKIPIRNLWLLLLYASDLLKEMREKEKKAVEDNPDDIPHLVAEILYRHVERRIKRNLSYAHQSCEMELSRVRGRINLLRTERRQLLARGKVACQFDELTADTVRNRFVRAALMKISKMVKDSPNKGKDNNELSHDCRVLANRLQRMGVVGARPSRSEMSIDRLGRQDTDDQNMVAAAQLVFDLALPTEMAGDKDLSVADGNAPWFRRLFEKGIAGFYDVKLAREGWVVKKGEKLKWPVEEKTERLDKILPGMETDITLEHAESGCRIVIDTKFTEVITAGWYRKKTLKSGHIYQIYAYLRSQENSDDALSTGATGILLYPAVGETLNESVKIQGHKICFVTVDLTKSAPEIIEQLLQIAKVDEDVAFV